MIDYALVVICTIKMLIVNQSTMIQLIILRLERTSLLHHIIILLLYRR